MYLVGKEVVAKWVNDGLVDFGQLETVTMNEFGILGRCAEHVLTSKHPALQKSCRTYHRGRRCSCEHSCPEGHEQTKLQNKPTI
jgi:hypothetical protein